ncbi:MAG: hypothetical protein IPP49_09490 [Saprospiraceae bacterium]|nr:hypothetical protein [Saprospiraceae bacterium]
MDSFTLIKIISTLQEDVLKTDLNSMTSYLQNVSKNADKIDHRIFWRKRTGLRVNVIYARELLKRLSAKIKSEKSWNIFPTSCAKHH